MIICYSVESHFYRVRYQFLTHAENMPGTPCKVGFFTLYRVIMAHLFLIRSAACFCVIRFRQSGQYFMCFEIDAKVAPHTFGFRQFCMQFLTQRKHRSLKPFAKQRIRNKLRAYAFFPRRQAAYIFHCRSYSMIFSQGNLPCGFSAVSAAYFRLYFINGINSKLSIFHFGQCAYFLHSSLCEFPQIIIHVHKIYEMEVL